MAPCPCVSGITVIILAILGPGFPLWKSYMYVEIGRPRIEIFANASEPIEVKERGKRILSTDSRSSKTP